MSVRINVSMKNADRDFCNARDLSPSQLLRERINEIRDLASDNIKSRIIKLEEENKRYSSNIEKFQLLLQRYARVFEDELGSERFSILLQKV